MVCICRPEDLRVPFERFGPVKDVYLPKNYYTGYVWSALFYMIIFFAEFVNIFMQIVVEISVFYWLVLFSLLLFWFLFHMQIWLQK